MRNEHVLAKIGADTREIIGITVSLDLDRVAGEGEEEGKKRAGTAVSKPGLRAERSASISAAT